jgi:hypothetical protein
LTRSLSSCAPPEPRRSFANDFLLIRYQDNLIPLLKKIISARVPWRLYVTEGLDTRFLAQSQELCNLLKASQSQNIYLPVENVDDSILVSLNRKHVKLRHVVQAAENIGRAGFRMRHQGVSGYSCTMGGFLAMYDSEDKVLIPWDDPVSGDKDVEIEADLSMSILTDDSGKAKQIEDIRFPPKPVRGRRD